MRSDFDYYAVLGVAATAPRREIQRQYHQLAKIYHPDRNPGEEKECSERMQLVNEAYRVLSHPGSRARYDLNRKAEAFAPKGHAAASPSTSDEYQSGSAPSAGAWESGGVPPTFRPYVTPRTYPSPFVERPRSFMREAVIAVVAGGLVIAGIGMACYNLITPSSTPVAVVQPTMTVNAPSQVIVTTPAALNKPASVAQDRHPAAAIATYPRRRRQDSPVQLASSRHHRHHSLTSADKDAIAGALAAKVENARRAALGNDIYR